MSKSLKMPIINTNTAGIDIGSKEHWVAVNQNASDVKVFGVYQKDHKLLSDWLKTHFIEHVVMEATGSYWQTLYHHLEKEGFNVLLCNAKSIKNPQGKSDNKDCLWLQRLHSLGLLQGSFIPETSIEKIRQYNRYRNTLVEERSACINRMQKVLQLLNVRLDIVVSDISGMSGMAIIEAILKGERDKNVLASLAHNSVKKSKIEIADALCGNYREELLFQLEDQLDLYKRFNTSVEKTELKMEAELRSVEPAINYDSSIKIIRKKTQKGQQKIDVASLSYQYFGVNLMAVEGISNNTIMSIISEVGRDIYKFKTAKCFASWLRLAPNNRISGGKIISHRTPKSKNILALAFRNAANTIAQRKEGSLRTFFGRIAFRKGRGAAVTATARKLAIIVWNMIIHQKEYAPLDNLIYTEKIKQLAINKIKKTIKRFGIQESEIQMTIG